MFRDAATSIRRLMAGQAEAWRAVLPRRALTAMLLAATGTSLALAGTADSPQSRPSATPPIVLAQAAGAAPTIPVILPQTQTVAETLEITGNAAAVNQVSLVARVVGYLEQLHFEDGALVRKGDLLATIQQDQYKAQLQQAQAQIQLQKAALAYAKTEVGRYRALLKDDAATQVEVDHWIFEQQSAEANLSAARAQVELAELNMSYTEVRAPFDGLMGKHLIDPGNLVGASSTTSVLAEIQQTDPIYVEANISSQQALQVRENLHQRRLTLEQVHQVPVDVALPDNRGYIYHGTVEYVAPEIDPRTGTLLVRGILSNPNRNLVPGMFVNMRLPMGKISRGALLVPDGALQEDQGGRYLLVVGPGDVVQQRYVKLGDVIGGLRVIVSGISEADRIVTGELWRAPPGTKVTPQLTTTGR